MSNTEKRLSGDNYPRGSSPAGDKNLQGSPSSGDKNLQGSFHSKRCKPIDVMRKQLEDKGLVGRTTHDIHSDIMKTVTMMQELAIDTPTSGDQQPQEIQRISEIQPSQDEKLKVTSGDKKTPAEMREAADQTIALANTLRAQRENQPHYRFAITERRRAENDTHKDLKQRLKKLSSSSWKDLKNFWEQTEIAQQLNGVLDEEVEHKKALHFFYCNESARIPVLNHEG